MRALAAVCAIKVRSSPVLRRVPGRRTQIARPCRSGPPRRQP